MTSPINLLRASCLAALLAVAALPASAQNPPVPGAPAQWESFATAGLTLTKGNSDTLLANLGVISAKKWDKNEIALGASIAYGENSGTKNVDNISGSAQYNRLFSDRVYGGIRLNAAKDQIADLDYRVNISPLVGYYFIKDATTRLSGEVGPSYVIESLGGVSKSYAGVRLGERFEHKFNDRAKLWQSADITTQVDRTSKYLVAAEIGASAAITAQTSLRIVLQDAYDSIPAAGRKANDLRLISGVEYKF